MRTESAFGIKVTVPPQEEWEDESKNGRARRPARTLPLNLRGKAVETLLVQSPNLHRRLGLFSLILNIRSNNIMKHNFKKLIFCLVLYFIPANGNEVDTVKVYKADDVVITATRSAIAISDAPTNIRFIDFAEIQNIGGTTVADLFKYALGADVRDYGGTGGMKNVKLRGLSSENIQFLMDGCPINIAQYGYLDLSLLPISLFDRMEVSNGGASAFYGGNALGGVVNLNTRKSTEKLRANVAVESGSFGHKNIFTEISNKFLGVGILANFANESGKDDFEFINHRTNSSDTVMKRTNADYKRTQFFVSTNYNQLENISMNASLVYVKIDRGVPGSISFPSSARQDDESYRLIINSNANILGDLKLTLSGIYNYDNQNYSEIIPFSPTAIVYKNRSFSINLQTEYSPVAWDRIISGIDYTNGWLDAKGISWGFPFAMNPKREQKSAYISNELYINNDSEWADRIIIYKTIRYDGYSDVKEDAISPKIGFNLRINKEYNLRLRSSYGKNFRVPTFNDLYYPNFSNPKLAPERSTAFDIGIISSLEKSGNQTIGITYFNIATSDKIVLGAGWLPYNIGKAKNSGLEARYDYSSVDKKINFFFSYTRIDAMKKNKDSQTDATYNKQLVYIPKSSGSFGISIDSEIGTISINNTITGLRYTNADNTSSLPAFTLTDVVISRKIDLGLFGILVRGVVSNLFDVDYQSVLDYPMPGRSFRISFGVEY